MRDFSKSLMVCNEDPYKFRRGFEKEAEDYEEQQLKSIKEKIEKSKSLGYDVSKMSSLVVKYLGEWSNRYNRNKKISSPEHNRKMEEFKKRAEELLKLTR